MVRLIGAGVMVAALGIASSATAARYDCRDSTKSATYVEFDSARQIFRLSSTIDGKTVEGATVCDFMKRILGVGFPEIDSAKCGMAFSGGIGVADMRIESVDTILSAAFDQKAMTLAVITRFGTKDALAETMKCVPLPN